MLHYLHHIIFDPLSAWEKFKLGCLGFPLIVGIVVLLYVIVYLQSKVGSK
jgi:hypothetical protein